jgi:hypothetical protein
MTKWRVTVAAGGIGEAEGDELTLTKLVASSPRLITWSFEGQPPTVTVIDVQVEATSETDAGEQGVDLVNRGARDLGLTLDARVREVRELTEEGKGVSR